MNQILLGDCLELMRDIPDKSVGMILCDLPYGSTKCRWDSALDFKVLWDQYKRIRKDTTPIVLFGSQPFTSSLGFSNIGELRYSWVWKKSRATGHLNSKKQPLTGFEDILVFFKRGGGHITLKG